MHILDLENTSQLRILYATADIPSGTLRVFTTNKLENVIGFETPEEIKRRVHLVNIDKFLIMWVKRSVTFTEKIIVKKS